MKLQRTLNPLPTPSTSKSKTKESEQKQSSAKTPAFSDTLSDSMEAVNKLQKEADLAIEALATGETKDVAQTMIAVEKANVSFKLMSQVRNRLVEAYQEVLRMQS